MDRRVKYNYTISTNQNPSYRVVEKREETSMAVPSCTEVQERRQKMDIYLHVIVCIQVRYSYTIYAVV